MNSRTRQPPESAFGGLEASRVQHLTGAIAYLLMAIPGPASRHAQILSSAYRQAYPKLSSRKLEDPSAATAAACHTLTVLLERLIADWCAQEGGALSAQDFAKTLGLSATTIRRYRAGNKIIALPQAGGSGRYPVWQIHQEMLLPGLEEVLTILSAKGSDRFTILTFFLSPSERFHQRRPLDLLREGRVEPVLRAAKLGR